MDKNLQILEGEVISLHDTEQKLLLAWVEGRIIPTVVRYKKGEFTVGQRIKVEHRGSYHVHE